LTQPRLQANPIRLAAVAAGPVFYQTPLYRQLAADPRVDLTVIFASSGGVRPYNASFGDRAISWDIDLVGGYQHRFLKAADSNEVHGGFFALKDWDIVKEIRRGRFDAVWVHGFSYFTLALAIVTALTKRVPVLFRDEQTLLHERPWPKRWFRALVLRVLFRRIYTLAIGSNNREYFRRYRVREDRLFFAPYCVDNDVLQADAKRLAEQRELLRSSFGIPSDSGPILLFVGKLAPKKQPLLVLEAHARIRARMRCALLIVGEGELKPELSARIERDQIEDVYFAGFLNRSEISRAYAVADVFALPSAFHETWGIVVNEAMNFSLPVVVSDKVGCVADLVREQENGLIVRHDDVAGFAAAIESLLTDPYRRSAFGARSLEIINGWRYDVAREGIVQASRSAICGSRRSGAQTLRVAMFPMLPPINAATRAFCERPLFYLARHGIRGRIFSPASNRAFERLLRQGKPLHRVRAAIYWYVVVLPRRLVQIVRAMTYDVIFIQRSMFRMTSPPVLERLTSLVAGKLLHKPIVYHCDDALYTVAKPRRFRSRFELADCVLTGNTEIAKFAATVNRNVVHYDGAIEVSRYPVKKHVQDHPIVIGWVGHGANHVLKSFLPVLKRVCEVETAVFKVVSDVRPGATDFGDALIFERWALDREFALFADFDIGIMPLDDTVYNRGKEAYKIKEYMAAGLPVVCSAVGHNVAIVEHGVTGLLAFTDEDWIAHLTRLIREPDFRAKLGAAGRRLVGERYALPDQADRLAQLLKALVDREVRDPIGQAESDLGFTEKTTTQLASTDR
jgi:glycosyltransferase involved in cell wall biosynthesis